MSETQTLALLIGIALAWNLVLTLAMFRRAGRHELRVDVWAKELILRSGIVTNLNMYGGSVEFAEPENHENGKSTGLGAAIQD